MTAGRTLAPYAAGSATVTGVLAMADLRAGDLVAERFRIVRLIGMGGMGVVYQAHDTELDVDVALKLLRPELASRPDAFERFRQELLLARQVSSPHVVRIHDLVRHGEVWLISMDFVPGQSLERLLDTQGHLPPEDAIRIVRQLALGLGAAHQRGVVHRDLKPANVLISEDGEARITDFGVARSAGATGITVSGVIIGTPEYLSPEQARAEPVDGRSDLYALGLIFFEMLTGTLPFRGGTPAEMLAQRIVRDPPPPDTVKNDLPAFAVRLCSRLLELKPARRFQSADEVIRAIDERRVRGGTRRSRSIVATSLAALLLIAAAGAIWRYNATRTSTSQAAATVVPLDLAPMPMLVSGGKADDADLAAGLRQLFAAALTSAPGLRSADPRRVDRALAELGYDADAARRQRGRVVEFISARRLLESELKTDDAGRHVVSVSLWMPSASEPYWTAATPAANDAELPNALEDLQAKLALELRIHAEPAASWPDAASIRLVGQLYRQKSLGALKLGDAIAAARSAHDANVWWSLEEALDRSGQTSDAATVARAAKDDLDGKTTRDAALARAYADLLLGEIESAEKALAAIAAASPNDHRARLLLARAYGELGNFEEANKTLDALVREDPRNVDAWFSLGKYSIMQGDAKRAVDDYLVRAWVLANRLDDARGQADVANALGVGLRHLGQAKLASEQFEKAARLRGDLQDHRGQAVSLRNLATVRSMQGDFKAATEALDSARAILRPLGDPAAMSDVANDQGVLEEERGEYRKALDAYREALGYRQSAGDPRLIGESQINVGFTYYQVGEFDNAQTYLEQASSTYAKIDDRSGAVNARLSLYLVQMARGDFNAARRSLDSSLRDAEELQMAEALVISQAGLAQLDYVEGRIESAALHAQNALDQFRKREDPRGIVEMQLLLAAIASSTGSWDVAETALGDLAADKIENREQAAMLLSHRGEIALGRGDAAQALAKANEAIAESRSAHSYATELVAQLLRARALTALSKASEAGAEIASARSGLAKYASVPLRLQFVEAALQVNGVAALPDYRAARAELARLPSYGRAFEIHALAATTLRKQSDAGEAEATRAAREAYGDLAKTTPPAQQPALAKLAAAYGLSTAVANE